jgi:hypothetical protein
VNQAGRAVTTIGVGMKTKMIISYFGNRFKFFRFLGLNENGGDNEKKKKMIKIIENESENNFVLFRLFSKIVVFSW